MLMRLGLETRAHHAVADADRLAILDDPQPERYRAFLETIYAFESAYEQSLIQTPGLPPRAIRRRARTKFLRNDLLVLGVTDLEDLVRPGIPAFRSEPEALGWVYVVERNTLLHNLIRRHLWRTLPGILAHAGSYLGAYGNTPGAHYRDLGIELDDAAHRAIPSQIVAAANTAFVAQHTWFAQAQPQRLAS
jgi:heme oxygenase